MWTTKEPFGPVVMRKVSPGRGAATSGGSGGAALTVRGKKKKEPSKRGKLTRKDIHKERAELPALTKKLVKRLVEGDAEIKENAAFAILHILEMDHGIHADTIFKAKTVKPLVALLTNGSANAQTNAAAALAGIAACAARSRCAHLWVLALPCPCLPLADPEVLGSRPAPRSKHPTHQEAIVAANGVEPLVCLLKTGSAKVQEEACHALAALDADAAYQKDVIRLGAIPALVAVLRNGSAQAQASAAQATANVAACSKDAQRNIAKHGAIPLLLSLLGVGKAQKPAAAALAKLAHENHEIQGTISEAGGIAPLLALLNGLDVDVQVAP